MKHVSLHQTDFLWVLMFLVDVQFNLSPDCHITFAWWSLGWACYCHQSCLVPWNCTCVEVPTPICAKVTCSSSILQCVGILVLMLHDSQFQWSLPCSLWLVQSRVWSVSIVERVCRWFVLKLLPTVNFEIILYKATFLTTWFSACKIVRVYIITDARLFICLCWTSYETFLYSVHFFYPFSISPVWTYPPSLMSFASMMQDPFAFCYAI